MMAIHAVFATIFKRIFRRKNNKLKLDGGNGHVPDRAHPWEFLFLIIFWCHMMRWGSIFKLPNDALRRLHRAIIIH